MHGSLGLHVWCLRPSSSSVVFRRDKMMETGIRNKESISNRMLHVLLQNERCLLLSIKKESLYYLQLQL